VRYWLGLHNGNLANTNDAEVLWETTNPNLSTGANEDPLPPAGDGWFNNHSEHAFELTGVPELGTVTLFSIGAIGMLFVRERKVRNALSRFTV